MIGHVAEVWLALFAAFAVGSLLGWLIYRWIDRSDYALDQQEFTGSAGRKRRRQSVQQLPAAVSAPSPRVPAAPARRPGRAVQPRPARDAQLPAAAPRIIAGPPSPPRLPPPLDLPAPAAPPRGGGIEQLRAKLRANTGAPGAAARDAESPGPGGHDDAPWPAKAEPWPIERPVAVNVTANDDARRQTQSGSNLFAPLPNQNEIWSERPAQGPGGPAESGSPEPALPAGDGVVWSGFADSAMRPDADVDFDAPPMPDLQRAEAAPPAEPETARPPSVPRPERPDDFRKIRGIGPAFERQLNELGIYRYTQIAGWTGAEQRWIGQQFGFVGRIERDDWVGQAAALARRREAATAEDPVPGS